MSTSTRAWFVLGGVLLGCTTDSAERRLPIPSELIRQSERYHDPEGRWFSSTNRFTFQQLRTGVEDRIVEFTLHPSSDQFEISMREGSDSAAGRVSGSVCEVPDSISAGAVERFGTFDCDAVLWWRDYYSYQVSAPMHLNDHSAAVDSITRATTFLGDPVYAVRVAYGPGQPIWDYYFDPVDSNLKGARFSSDGLGNDGECITYEGEAVSGRIRLPARRSWYMNADSSLVGEDILVDIDSRGPPQ